MYYISQLQSIIGVSGVASRDNLLVEWDNVRSVCIYKK